MIVSFIFISLIFSFIACIIKFLRYHLRGLAIGLCCLALGSGSSALMLMTCFLSSFFANGDIFDFKYTTVYPGEGFFFTIGGILAIFSALILISVEPICTVGGERVSWKRDDFMINEFRRILVQDSLFMTFLMRFLWTSVSLALSVFWITRKVSLFFKQSSTLAQKVTNLLAKLCVKNNNWDRLRRSFATLSHLTPYFQWKMTTQTTKKHTQCLKVSQCDQSYGFFDKSERIGEPYNKPSNQ